MKEISKFTRTDRIQDQDLVDIANSYQGKRQVENVLVKFVRRHTQEVEYHFTSLIP